jgi:hypothetical protein
LEEPYQIFYRRSHFSMKNRGAGAILFVIESSTGALPGEEIKTLISPSPSNQKERRAR